VEPASSTDGQSTIGIAFYGKLLERCGTPVFIHAAIEGLDHFLHQAIFRQKKTKKKLQVSTGVAGEGENTFSKKRLSKRRQSTRTAFLHTKMQGCQIYLGKIYQITTKYTKRTKNISNGCKIDQMDIKYSNIFHSKALQS
jgi:hypothetical protein